jgi:HAD superfamily hydrolase (TIGR01549 family)
MDFSRNQIRAVTFDAYGTLLRLDRPFERLAGELKRIGIHVPMEIVAKVFLREMSYYRKHHLEGNNPENLLSLRFRCADLLFKMLAQEGYEAQVAREDRLRVLMGSIRFALYEDALSVLDWCTANGLATGVISAWDCSLVATLKEHCPHAFSQVIVSAIEGIDKSEPSLFLKAAQSFGIPPGHIIHVGDEIENDIQIAGEAGLKTVLLDRDQAHKGIGSQRIESLEEFPNLIEKNFGFPDTK